MLRQANIPQRLYHIRMRLNANAVYITHASAAGSEAYAYATNLAFALVLMVNLYFLWHIHVLMMDLQTHIAGYRSVEVTLA